MSPELYDFDEFVALAERRFGDRKPSPDEYTAWLNDLRLRGRLHSERASDVTTRAISDYAISKLFTPDDSDDSQRGRAERPTLHFEVELGIDLVALVAALYAIWRRSTAGPRLVCSIKLPGTDQICGRPIATKRSAPDQQFVVLTCDQKPSGHPTVLSLRDYAALK